ncbi:MAG TPA: glucose 1-dehydrogenase [Xanthobacteraceae bacterium]|jgi:NAD(P)-dependent dehydrogenase (short-subunit alcohol dehydrogenase family)|nr:glucose 1-dehydrogenase [Xanthobacteraceae bacterium]
MNRLDGKIALISGGARGIGAETARKMAAAGAAVVIGDVLAERVRETAREIADAGGRAFPLALDVTAEDSWSAAVALATKQFGKLDILVNNAGMFLGKDLMDATMEEWSRLVAINMTGVWLGTKACAPALAESGKSSRHGSAIVNLASVAGLVGSQLDPLYSMSKGGVTLFTKSAALSFARKGWKIRVNSIHPGVIETDMGAQTFVSRARQAGSNDVEGARNVAARQHPIGRLGLPEDIALGIVFLASDDAGFMTGSGMVVDGGLTAQ